MGGIARRGLPGHPNSRHPLMHGVEIAAQYRSRGRSQEALQARLQRLRTAESPPGPGRIDWKMHPPAIRRPFQ